MKIEKLADRLKEKGHNVIRKEDYKDFDDMVFNNCSSWRGVEYINSIMSYCTIMRKKDMSLDERCRTAYHQFQDEDHSGHTAAMTLSAILRFCEDGKDLVKWIENCFDWPLVASYDTREKEQQDKRKVREYLVSKMRGGHQSKVEVFTTNDGMFLVELPYRYDRFQCLSILQSICKDLGLCYGIFNGVPMFSFDTEDTFFMRYENGMTKEDYEMLMEALRYDPQNGKDMDLKLAEKILKEKTWKHLGKKQ